MLVFFNVDIVCWNLFLQVMNGVIIGHNGKDYTNGSAPLRSLPVTSSYLW